MATLGTLRAHHQASLEVEITDRLEHNYRGADRPRAGIESERRWT